MTHRLPAAACVALLITGCASAPLARTYVLGSPQPAAMDRLPALAGDRIFVGAVAIPDYLDSTDILTREGDHRLVTSPTGRWGERLSAGLRDALAAELRTRLQGYFITTTRDLAPTGRQLWVTVSSWDVWSDGRCMLSASWSIVDKGGLSPILSHQTSNMAPGAGPGAGGDGPVVASMASAVATLADRIAASLANSRQPLAGATTTDTSP